jgi:hypothetical protein
MGSEASVNLEVHIRLVRIRKVNWDVLAMPEVLDELQGVDPSYRPVADSMFALLRRRVPEAGPPKGEISEPLGDGIFEFRRQPQRGPKLRVLWFYDAGRVIICTRAFLKDVKKCPPEEKARALKIRDRYLQAKTHQQVTITELEDM